MRIRRYTKNRRGAGMVEYGLLVGLIAVGAVVAVDRTGGGVKGLLNTVAAELEGVGNVVAVSGDTDAGDVDDQGGLGPADCPFVGDTCDDDTIYAGNLADFGGPDRAIFAGAQVRELAFMTSPSNIDVPGVPNIPDTTTPDWDGYANTAALVAQLGTTTPAADFCWGETTGGHDDWYLPATSELDVLFQNRAAIPGLNLSGNWPDGYYWSSSEHPTTNWAWRQNMGTGERYAHTKPSYVSVRCIRSPGS